MLQNCTDELWVGVKCQSNPEIAGSPRNGLRFSPGADALPEVGRWMDEGAWRLPTPTKPRMPAAGPGSETAGAKIRRREGNSPDPRLRPLSLRSSGKGGRTAQTTRRLA